ncbi:MAG TPA: biotin-dependent carboxyltransferase family protein [Candidatus Dormibacteraeota bacterium]|nr:biotin-dependent carboxyltransferase family protein [Candidatus Dormibacteraeota bacterium]
MSAALRVVEPGLFTTVQDLGRPNAIASGVPSGGAMDRFAHRAANLVVGNAESEATLECTLTGPHLVAERPCLIAVTGADLDLRVNEQAAPMWTGIFLGRADRLTFGARRSGSRAYIAIAGGIEADRWLGSASTNLMAGRGGMHGRNLKAGDQISGAHISNGRPAVSGVHLPAHLRPDYSDHTLFAIAGPHVNVLDADGRALLFGGPFKVSREADRMGYRLEGPKLITSGEELLSFGLTTGAVQVPHGGQPILLMADHQTAGGYPVVAGVVSASIPIAAQLVPGDELRFAEITLERARQLRVLMAAALDTLR